MQMQRYLDHERPFVSGIRELDTAHQRLTGKYMARLDDTTPPPTGDALLRLLRDYDGERLALYETCRLTAPDGQNSPDTPSGKKERARIQSFLDSFHERYLRHTRHTIRLCCGIARIREEDQPENIVRFLEQFSTVRYLYPPLNSERIRRRRECLRCQKRFTTYEVVETVPIIVIKKNGMQEPFDREKLLRGVLRACEKRPVPVEKLEKLVTDIETELQNSMQREVTSETIGELALAALREVDEVAYVRFASVYRRFKDIDSFLEELEKLRDSHEN